MNKGTVGEAMGDMGHRDSGAASQQIQLLWADGTVHGFSELNLLRSALSPGVNPGRFEPLVGASMARCV